MSSSFFRGGIFSFEDPFQAVGVDLSRFLEIKKLYGQINPLGLGSVHHTSLFRYFQASLSDHSLEIQAFHSQTLGTSPLHLCELYATCLFTYRHRSLLLLLSDTMSHLSPLLLIPVALCSGYTRLLPDMRSSGAGVILHSPGSTFTPVTC